jgi:hypothetical protein
LKSNNKNNKNKFLSFYFQKAFENKNKYILKVRNNFKIKRETEREEIIWA